MAIHVKEIYMLIDDSSGGPPSANVLKAMPAL